MLKLRNFKIALKYTLLGIKKKWREDDDFRFSFVMAGLMIVSGITGVAVSFTFHAEHYFMLRLLMGAVYGFAAFIAALIVTMVVHDCYLALKGGFKDLRKAGEEEEVRIFTILKDKHK